MDWDDFPWIGGQGSVHDLRDNQEPEPRLWFAKSVSRNAAVALAKKPAEPKRNPIGFHRVPRG